MKLKVIAGILGLPLETLRNRDKAWQLELSKKKAQIQQFLALSFGIITVIALVGGTSHV